MKENMIITIVTVTYNNLEGLKRTLASVTNQSKKNFEVIVVDGNSDDGTKDFLRDFKMLDHGFDFDYISEKDSGIFEAINKGVKFSNTDWVICLNAGDGFFDNTIISFFNKLVPTISKKINVIYGDCFLEKESRIIKSRLPSSIVKGESFASHQSMLIRNCFYYDEKMKIFSDLYLLMSIYKVYGPASFFKVNKVISTFEGGGISDQVSKTKRLEKALSIYRIFGFFSCVGYYFAWLIKKLRDLL